MNIVVLISGNGSNLQSIINAQQNGLNINIQAIISNNPDAYGLQRAKQAGLKTEIIPSKKFTDRDTFDKSLKDCVDQYNPEIIVLAGFMRILSSPIIEAYKFRIINIHPSLLPKYPGLNTHERVLENKDLSHGCSIHFVDEHLDNGPIIAQARTTVLAEDTASSLKEKVQRLEHLLYPKILTWFAEKRLLIKQETIFLDDNPLPPGGISFFFDNHDHKC